jgi:hypothetical protein
MAVDVDVNIAVYALEMLTSGDHADSDFNRHMAHALSF